MYLLLVVMKTLIQPHFDSQLSALEPLLPGADQQGGGGPEVPGVQDMGGSS